MSIPRIADHQLAFLPKRLSKLISTAEATAMENNPEIPKTFLDTVSLSKAAIALSQEQEESGLTPQPLSNSLLSNNFLNRNQEKSRYVKSTIDGLNLEKSFSHKMNAILGAASYAIDTAILAAEIRGSKLDHTYVAPLIEGIKTERRIDDLKKEEVQEHSQEDLEKAKEEIEESAEKTLLQNVPTKDILQTPGTDIPLDELPSMTDSSEDSKQITENLQTPKHHAEDNVINPVSRKDAQTEIH